MFLGIHSVHGTLGLCPGEDITDMGNIEHEDMFEFYEFWILEDFGTQTSLRMNKRIAAKA